METIYVLHGTLIFSMQSLKQGLHARSFSQLTHLSGTNEFTTVAL